MTTIEKLQSGLYDLSKYSEEQKAFILAVAKMSYNDGMYEEMMRIINLIYSDKSTVEQPFGRAEERALQAAEIKTQKPTISPEEPPF